MRKNRKITKMIVASTLILSFLIPSNFASANDYYYYGKKLTKKQFDKIDNEKIQERYKNTKECADKIIESDLKFGGKGDKYNTFFYTRFNDWENYYLPASYSGLLNTLEYINSEECEKQWIENCKIATIGLETPHQVGNPKSTSGIHGTFLYKGNSFDLMVKGGSGSYTYSSTKPSVATVSASGIVKAVSKGVAGIKIYDTITTRTKIFYIDVRNKSEKKADDVRLKIYNAMYKWKTSVSFPKKNYSKAYIFKVMTKKDLKKAGLKYLKTRDYYNGTDLDSPTRMYDNLDPDKANYLLCQQVTGFTALSQSSIYANSLRFDIKETKKNIIVKWKYPKGIKKLFEKAKKIAPKYKGESDLETLARILDFRQTTEYKAIHGGPQFDELLLLNCGITTLNVNGRNEVYFDGGWYSYNTSNIGFYFNELGSIKETGNPKMYRSMFGANNLGPFAWCSDGDMTKAIKSYKKYAPYYTKSWVKLNERNDFIDTSYAVNFDDYVVNENGTVRGFSASSSSGPSYYVTYLYRVRHGLSTWAEIFQEIFLERSGRGIDDFNNTFKNYRNIDHYFGFTFYDMSTFTSKGYVDPIKESGLFPDYVNPIQRKHDQYTYLNSLAKTQ